MRTTGQSIAVSVKKETNLLGQNCSSLFATFECSTFRKVIAATIIHSIGFSSFAAGISGSSLTSGMIRDAIDNSEPRDGSFRLIWRGYSAFASSEALCLMFNAVRLTFVWKASAETDDYG